MSIFKKIGKALGGAIKGTVGKLPIVGGAASHIGNALSGKEPFLKGLLGGAAPLLLGAGTFGFGPAAGIFSKIGGALGGKVGGALGTHGFGGALGHAAGQGLGMVGKMSPGQLAGLGMGISNIVGAGKQRRSAERYTNALTSQRNELMSRILQQPNYNFTPEQ